MKLFNMLMTLRGILRHKEYNIVLKSKENIDLGSDKVKYHKSIHEGGYILITWL